RGRLAQVEQQSRQAEVESAESWGQVQQSTQRWHDSRAKYEKMEYLHRLWQSWEEAQIKLQYLSNLVHNRKYQLLRTDWRSLRGTAFEEFLQQVFEALGYTVQTTKASGDQGIDLIVIGSVGKVAVQAKGYSDNVGNHAVMEAHAGMGYYQCHR